MFNNQNVKSSLAKLLATENLNVRHSAYAKTGTFDVKKRILTLPIWKDVSEDLYDLLVGHEVGHALNTPPTFEKELDKLCKEFDAKPKSMFGFMNVIEDARIDKLQKRKFPGLRKNYFNGYRELIEKNFFGTKSVDVNTMTFIDRLNVYEKGGGFMPIQFNDKEKALLKIVEDAETWDDVIEAVRKVYQYSKFEEGNTNAPDSDMTGEESDEEGEGEESDKKSNKKSKKPSNKKPSNKKPSDKKDDKDKSDGKDKDKSDKKDKDDKSDGSKKSDGKDSEGSEDEDSDADGNQQGDEGDGEESEGNSEGDTEGSEGDEEGQGGSGGSDPEQRGTSEDASGNEVNGGGGSGAGASGFINPDPTSKTDAAWTEKAGDLINKNAKQIHYIHVPEVSEQDYKNIVVDYPIVMKQKAESFKYMNKSTQESLNKKLEDFREYEKNTISFMLKEFEMRKAADSYAKNMIAKTGVLNTNKMYAYKFSDDLFKKQEIQKAGKSHGFVIFVDWSGSMNTHLDKTVQQMISVSLFCKAARIPFEVYAFKTAGSSYGGGSSARISDRSDGSILWTNFELRNILSSRMKPAEFTTALQYLTYQTSGIPCQSDQLGGTPLDPSIVVAEKIVNKFQRETRVQIVNVVFLTDGASDGMSGVNGITVSWNDTMILQDKKTKKEYDLTAGGMTNVLLKTLKDRTGCNLIGFYILDANESSLQYLVKKVDGKVTKMWNEEGHVLADSTGYDEYYILNPNMMSTRAPDLTLKGNEDKFAKAFIDHSKIKIGRRSMVRKFIAKICAQAAQVVA